MNYFPAKHLISAYHHGILKTGNSEYNEVLDEFYVN